MQSKPIGLEQLDAALTMLAELLLFDTGEPIHLVVCGGSALIAMELVQRTTQDLDVQSALNLPENWLNNGPSSNSGGYFRWVSLMDWK